MQTLKRIMTATDLETAKSMADATLGTSDSDGGSLLVLGMYGDVLGSFGMFWDVGFRVALILGLALGPERWPQPQVAKNYEWEGPAKPSTLNPKPQTMGCLA